LEGGEVVNFISMCSGIEAASVAFGPLGWTPIAFSEIEPFPCAVLKHHYPDVPNVGDLAAFDWSVYRGKADAVCAGFPCQAFSIAGLGKSLEDNRGNLSLVGVKAIRLIRSRWVLLEQVPGVLSKPDNPFGCILAGLCGADAPLLPGTKNGKWSSSGIVLPANKDGYGLAWRVLDAQYFGVPQRRRRVFVVGYLGDWRPAAEVLFEPSGLRGDPSQSGAAGQGATPGVKGGVGADGRSLAFKIRGAVSLIGNTPTLAPLCGRRQKDMSR
jgi:DNA (cytosine-5)-methyltransferase 1